MRAMRNLTGTLLVASLGAFAYASVPPTATAPAAGNTFSAQQQQDQTPPPKQDESKPKSDETKSPRADKKADKQMQQKPQPNNDRQQPRDKDQKAMQGGGHAQGGGQHGRIADNDYKAHFGQTHSFSVRRVVTTTRVVPNQTRFVYGGYTFVFVQAWPADWAMTDDCYIDYIDGEYVLIDVAHPGVQIMLNIVE